MCVFILETYTSNPNAKLASFYSEPVLFLYYFNFSSLYKSKWLLLNENECKDIINLYIFSFHNYICIISQTIKTTTYLWKTRTLTFLKHSQCIVLNITKDKCAGKLQSHSYLLSDFLHLLGSHYFSFFTPFF